MAKKFKKIVVMLLGLSSGLLLSVSVFGLGTYVTVSKTGAGDVCSGSTGSNTYYAFYGGDRTSGTMYVTAQYYEAGIWKDVPGFLTLNEYNTSDWSSVNMPPYKLYRVCLSGWTGRGSGWAQGQD